VAGSDANITATQVGNDFRFKPLNAGTNITIEETTLPGAITINAAAVSPTTLFQNNILYVDEQYGNNATGLRERFDRPFQTIAATLSASLANDLIYVLPGNYTGVNLTINNTLSIYLSEGTSVSGGVLPIFNVSSAKLIVYGSGIITSTANVLSSTLATVSIEADQISGNILANNNISIKCRSYNGSITSNQPGLITIIADTINSTGRFFTNTSDCIFNCQSNRIICDSLFSSTSACNINIVANAIRCSRLLSGYSMTLTDSSPAGTDSLIRAIVTCNEYVVLNGSIASGTSATKTALPTNNTGLQLYLNANYVYCENSNAVGNIDAFLSTRSNIYVNCNKFVYGCNGTTTLFQSNNGTNNVRIVDLHPIPGFPTAFGTFCANSNIDITSAVIGGSATNSNLRFNTLTSTDFRIIGNSNFTAKSCTNSNSVNPFISNSVGETTIVSIDNLTLNSTVNNSTILGTLYLKSDAVEFECGIIVSPTVNPDLLGSSSTITLRYYSKKRCFSPLHFWGHLLQLQLNF
jgi:hypothetical protein